MFGRDRVRALEANRLRTRAVLAILLVGILLQVIEGWRFDLSALNPRVEPPVRLLDLSVLQANHTLYSHLAEVAPGAHILVAEGTERVSPLFLREFAGASSVRRVALPSLAEDRFRSDVVRIITEDGALESGPWRSLMLAGPVERVLIGSEGRVVMLVDARILDVAERDALRVRDELPGTRAAYRPPKRTVIGTIAVDAGLLVGWLILGGLLVPRHGVDSRLRIPFAFLVGIAGQMAIGLTLLPAPPALGLFIAGAVAWAALSGRQGHPTGWGRRDAGALVAAGLALIGVSTLVRSTGYLLETPDSFAYWAMGSALSSGELVLADLDPKRSLGLAALHAPGFPLGADGVHSVGAAALLAGCAVLVLLPRLLRDAASRSLRSAGWLAAAVLVTSAPIRVMAGYLNTHMVVGVALAMLFTAVILVERDRLPLRAAAAPIVAGIVIVVLSRAEALLVVGLVLASLLASRRMAAWRPPWVATSLALLAWNGLLVAASGEPGAIPLPVLAGLAAALLALVVAGLLPSLPARPLGQVPRIVVLALWTFTALLAFTPLGTDITFFSALGENLGRGHGQWGLTMPLVALLAVQGVLVASRDRDLAAPVIFVTGFAPTVLVAKLLDGTDRVLGPDATITGVLLSGGGRTGWGDSGNRMWMHAVPVVLALTVSALAGSDGRSMNARRALVTVGATWLAVLAILPAWAPAYLGPDVPPTRLVLLQRRPEGSAIMLGPVGGENVATQRFTLPEIDVPDDAEDPTLCVSVVLDHGVPAARIVAEVTLEHRDEIVRAVIAAPRYRAQHPVAVCVSVPTGGLLDGDAAVRVGVGAPIAPGDLSVLADDAGGIVAEVSVAYVAPSEDTRSIARRSVSTVTRSAVRVGPWVFAFLLAVASIPSDVDRSRLRRDAPL